MVYLLLGRRLPYETSNGLHSGRSVYQHVLGVNCWTLLRDKQVGYARTVGGVAEVGEGGKGKRLVTSASSKEATGVE